MAANPDLRTWEGNATWRSPGAERFGALPTATGGIARSAYMRVREAGIEVAPLLKKVGLAQHQIENPRIRLPVRSQINFLNLAAAALEDDLLGFHLALPFDLREIGLLFYVMASSEMLHEALQKAARYSAIVNDGIAVRCLEGPDVSLTLSYVGVDRYKDRHQIEYWMTAIVRIARRLTGLQFSPNGMRLIHRAKNDRAELEEFFGCTVEFGAGDDQIAFPASIRRMPVVDADPYLNRLLSGYCEEALSRQPKSRGSLKSDIENAVVPLLPHGKARIDEVARRLGVSQRTLARQLSSEGLTFSEVLEKLRADLASHYLSDRDLSISQIAWLLGYQEVSAFSHAFKRWTGKTPRDVRTRMVS